MEKQDYSINKISMIFQNMDKCGLRLTKPELDLCEECTNGSLCKLLYNPCPAKLVYTKLSQYEDTGLTPEEVQQMRWVPVEERLPEEGKRCLLYTPCDRILCVGYYAGKDERQHRHKWRLVTAMRSTQTLTKKVTHWLPLPKPPKEEKE